MQRKRIHKGKEKLPNDPAVHLPSQKLRSAGQGDIHLCMLWASMADLLEPECVGLFGMLAKRIIAPSPLSHFNQSAINYYCAESIEEGQSPGKNGDLF